MADLTCKQGEATTIYCDNKSAISTAKIPVFHSRTKHIDIRYHFIRSLVPTIQIKLKFCKSYDQLADAFTKALCKEDETVIRCFCIKH